MRRRRYFWVDEGQTRFVVHEMTRRSYLIMLAMDRDYRNRFSTRQH